MNFKSVRKKPISLLIIHHFSKKVNIYLKISDLFYFEIIVNVEKCFCSEYFIKKFKINLSVEVSYWENISRKERTRGTFQKKLRENLTVMNFRVSSAVTALENWFPLIMWRIVSIMLSLKKDFVLCVFMTWDIRVRVSCLRMTF